MSTTDRQNMNNPQTASAYARLMLAPAQAVRQEAFCTMWIDAQNHLIRHEELFRGTKTRVDIYPETVAKAAIESHATGVILAHNHPSGILEPSVLDIQNTKILARMLAEINVTVFDHIIVGDGNTWSFAESRML